MNNSLSLIKKQPIWLLSVFIMLTSSFYWLLIASDRYVSEAVIILESPEIAKPDLSFSSLLSGGSNLQDILLLKEYLLSIDILKSLDHELAIKKHYSKKEIDTVSRLSEDAHIEEFHNHYKKHITVNIDEYAKVLRLHVEAYDAETAQKIAIFLLEKGETHMNSLGQDLAKQQVLFMENQVKELEKKVANSRDRLLSYQNKHGQISPETTAKTISSVIASLESELAKLNTKREASTNYQSIYSPEIIKLDAEISAIQSQIKYEQEKMATTGGVALNSVISEYGKIDRQLMLNIDMYGGAITALENTRIDAARKLKQVSTLQRPSLAEYPTQPQRLYNAISYIVVTLVLTMIINMIIMLVKEHKD